MYSHYAKTNNLKLENILFYSTQTTLGFIEYLSDMVQV